MILDDHDEAYLTKRGYTPELIQADGWVSLQPAKYHIAGLHFEVTEPRVVTFCRFPTGSITAVELVNPVVKGYRKFPTPAADYLPILYANCSDFLQLETTRTVLLVEGIFDRVPVLRCNLPTAVMALLGLSASEKVIRFLKLFADRVFTMLDNDDPGREASEYLSKRLKSAGIWQREIHYSDKDSALWFYRAGVRRMAAQLTEQMNVLR